MANRTAEFHFGRLGAQANDPKFAGPAPLSISSSQNQFAGNAGVSIPGTGTN